MIRSFTMAGLAVCCGLAAWGQDLSGLGAGLLGETSAARQAIAAHDHQMAMLHLRQARAIAGQILNAAPADQKPVLVSVAREVDTTRIYTPVKPGKSGVMTARRLKKNTSVREVDTEQVDAKLDVTSASARLETAEAALENNDWTAADNALAAIPAGIVQTRQSDVMPLLKARDNLMLASARILEAKYKDAAAPLRAAAEALGDFEGMSHGPLVMQSANMRREIMEYAQRVGRDHDDAVDRIDEWMNSVNRWSGQPRQPQ